MTGPTDLRPQYIAKLRGMQRQAARVAQMSSRDRESRAAGAGAAASLAWAIGDIEAHAALTEVEGAWWCAFHDRVGFEPSDCGGATLDPGTACEPLPLYARTGAAG